MRSGVDRRHGPVSVEDHDLLAIRRGVVRVEIGAPGGRRETVGQARVGEDGVAVWFDDVDGRAVRLEGLTADRAVDVRGETEDVDHLTGGVVGDLEARTGERVLPLVGGSVLGVVTADRDDLVAGLVRGARGHVELAAVQVHEGQAVGAAVELDRRHARGVVRIDEHDAFVGGDGDARHRVDRDARKRAVGDRLVERGPRFAAPRAPEDDRRARRGFRQEASRSRPHRSTGSRPGSRRARPGQCRCRRPR